MVSPSGARAVMRCDELGAAPYSDDAGGLFRAFLTPAHAASLGRLAHWMEAAGMRVRLDAAANLIGRYEANIEGAPALLIGSHIDSVRDAGRYDGPLGIMLGVECVAALNEKRHRAPFAIEVIAFGDEEGSRFPASMLCSRAVAGMLSPEALAIADADGVGLLEARAAFAEITTANAEAPDFISAAYAPSRLLGFLEAHIEQGPVLEAEGLALGVVSGIAAQLRIQARVTGVAGHAGTSAMHLRRDALTGAAEMALAAERIARGAEGAVVATIGRMSLKPGAVNVVPGEAAFSLDIRAGEQRARDAAAARMKQEMESIALARGLGFDWREVQDLAAAPCDPGLSQVLRAAMVEAGHPDKALVSGAGHDAMIMSQLCPAAMLFIRCAGGVSHHPAESVTHADAEAALHVMLGFIEGLERRHG